ncbi:methyltransferase domain-containing protein [Mycobacterium sp. E1747]|uniref:methyltransferase domain-containing protein n=1 Tax=Mycobacterium sp. E1747 TaxID=1834128 RepID=UPI0008297660|nr:class I SAM-dependent methyltransferase [Mycobacterium sp. E1747]
MEPRCGEGLFAQRLARVPRNVIVIDADRTAVHRAVNRLPSTVVRLARFDAFAADPRSADLITFVAKLHHLPLRET